MNSPKRSSTRAPSQGLSVPRALRWALAGLPWVSLACSPVQLVPVQPELGSEATARASEVEVRASADATQRPWTVPHAFTPVRISVRNLGSEPVFVRLDDIHLSGPEASLRAVAPGSITPRKRVSSLGLDPGSPFVAPQIGGNSPYGRSEILVIGPPPGWVPGPHPGDPARSEIVGSAFSGGAIPSGETRSGLVYFRHVPADAGQLVLRVPVRPRSPQNAPAQVVEIVYTVQT